MELKISEKIKKLVTSTYVQKYATVIKGVWKLLEHLVVVSICDQRFDLREEEFEDVGL
tara:strand:- start:35 stop:208 length:174 start_codon:yes stop_codon:yes gene_type:complete